MEKYTTDEIHQMLARTDVARCNRYVSNCLLSALIHLPKEIVDKVLAETIIVSNDSQSLEGCTAMNCPDYHGRHYVSIIGKHEHFREPEATILNAILHEFAHVVLGHKGEQKDSTEDSPQQTREVCTLLGQWSADDAWIADMLKRYKDQHVNW